MKIARVSITRPSGPRGSTIAITIDDDASSLNVCRLEMTLADFSECITGHAHMRATVGRWIGKHAGKIGKQLEVRNMLLSGRPPYEKKAAAAWVRNHPELILTDGWQINDDGTGSQQNTRDKHHISLCRYVDAPVDSPAPHQAGNGDKTGGAL